MGVCNSYNSLSAVLRFTTVGEERDVLRLESYKELRDRQLPTQALPYAF